MRCAESIRQLKILRRIDAGRFTSIKDLAQEHEVEERTIRRDIAALQEAGFPLYDEFAGHRKVWRLLEPQHLTRIPLDYTIEPHGRFFAVYESPARKLVALVVYRKGAEEIIRRLHRRAHDYPSDVPQEVLESKVAEASA